MKTNIRRLLGCCLPLVVMVAALCGPANSATAAQWWSGDINSVAVPAAGFAFDDAAGYKWNQIQASLSSWALVDNNNVGGVTLSVVSQSVGARGGFASSNGGNTATNPIGRDYMYLTTTVNSAGGVGTVNMRFSGLASNSAFNLVLLGGTEHANRHFDFSVDGGTTWHGVPGQNFAAISSFAVGDLMFSTPPGNIPPNTSAAVNSDALGQIDFMVRKTWYAAGALGGNSNEGDWAGFQLISAIPEPTSGSLGLLALASTLGVMRRRR